MLIISAQHRFDANSLSFVCVPNEEMRNVIIHDAITLISQDVINVEGYIIAITTL